MQDGRKSVWSIPYVSLAFFPSLKQNFITYRSSEVSWRPDCIFGIHQLWQPGFSRVYSNCCCSCSFEAEIIKIGQSSHKIKCNNIVNFQESTTILNACTKKSGNLSKAPRTIFRRQPQISTRCIYHHTHTDTNNHIYDHTPVYANIINTNRHTHTHTHTKWVIRHPNVNILLTVFFDFFRFLQNLSFSVWWLLYKNGKKPVIVDKHPYN